MRIVLKASEIGAKLFDLPIPPNAKSSGYDRYTLMSLGRYVEDILLRQISNATNLKVSTDVNKKSIMKKVCQIGDIGVYLKGKADGFGFATYSVEDKIYRYQYIIEVKFLPTRYRGDSHNDIPEYYVPQVLSYMYLYETNILFYAQCADGVIVQLMHYDQERVSQFLSDIQQKVSEQMIPRYIQKLLGHRHSH